VAAESGDITRILERLTEVDGSAAEQLLPVVYDELRALAGSFFERQDPSHTLQPTALVHEAYLRLVRQPDAQWTGRDHFFAVAARAMRQILVDHARRRRAEKRGGQWGRITLDEAISPSVGQQIDFVELDEALGKLSKFDERKAQVVTLRFFGGLTNDAVAHVLGISRTTVADDWRVARAFLARELREGAAS
jgi:RNA polymerase sigma factor (TIGR02999 family)